MMKSLSVLLILALHSCFSESSQAQSGAASSPRNAFYIEGGGNGLAYSVNYERLVTDHLGVRVGGSAFEILGESMALFPALATALLGTGKHRVELGAGIVLVQGAEVLGSTVVGTGVVGYRYHPAERGLLGRAGVTPFWGKEGIGARIGISLGVAF